MIEVGIDTSTLEPELLTDEMVDRAAVVVTMGCAVDSNACPAIGRKDIEDWVLPDPEGMSAADVRTLRDTVRDRVAGLLDSLAAAQPKDL